MFFELITYSIQFGCHLPEIQDGRWNLRPLSIRNQKAQEIQENAKIQFNV